MKHVNLIILLALVLTSCNSNDMENTLVIKDSPYDVETTYNKVKTIITNNPNLKILLELDHAKNASSVDLTLRPTKIIMFGNPKLGTPLMQASQTASIDLPQKIIVYADADASTKIAYNDPLYLEERHTIQGKGDILKTISGALDKITNKAISETE